MSDKGDDVENSGIMVDSTAKFTESFKKMFESLDDDTVDYCNTVDAIRVRAKKPKKRERKIKKLKRKRNKR